MKKFILRDSVKKYFVVITQVGTKWGGGGGGGVCLYFKENLPIKHRKDLEILQGTVISEISLGSKKIFFIVAYRSPNQTKDEFDIFYEKLQDTLDSVKDEKPHCIILMGDLNCRSEQWCMVT